MTWTDRVITRDTRALQDLLWTVSCRLRYIRCGLHSGYPLCCALWFATWWSSQYTGWLGIAYRNWIRTTNLGDCQYIPCPLCILRKTTRQGSPLSCGCYGNRKRTPPLPKVYLGVDSDDFG